MSAQRERGQRFHLQGAWIKLTTVRRARIKGAGGSRKHAAIVLDDAYLYAIATVEALPQNRSGADKSWVEHAVRDWQAHYARAVRVR